MMPDFIFEKKLWRKGIRIVCGADEVGRGCIAGPVVASAVVFPSISDFRLLIHSEEREIIINDSKKLTPRQREISEKWIRENALTWGIGESGVGEIDRLGIVRATNSAVRRAVVSANLRLLALGRGQIEYLLADAFVVPRISGLRKGSQLGIVRGDEKSITIAAASIVAKVHRDKLMQKLSSGKRYEKYGWESNKGYGTALHRESIVKYGTTKHHRKQFLETFLRNVSIN
jgi:ribonuclease HII